ERFGVTVYDGLGQTEGHIFIANQLHMPIKPGSMGKPLRGYQAAVLDDSGNPEPCGTSGHLVIRNQDHPGLALGYRKDPERWAAVNRSGWYYTQDIAYVDEDGYYWYVARSDDLIKEPRIPDLTQRGRIRPARASSDSRGCGGGNPRSRAVQPNKGFRYPEIRKLRFGSTRR
ncbi:MAG: AMP-binding protein, partial [Deltaproteobacteria bacterium]|nr:AMP-binding protein [Deltaproteobacteria bacterium]